MSGDVIHTRLREAHKQRILELRQATGLTESGVVRMLIENSEIKLRPVPGATVELPVRRPAEFVPSP